MLNLMDVCRIVFLGVVFLFYAGCALSPQTIDIHPSLDTSGTATVSGKRLWIEVKDMRESNIIGYRGGVYDTASISTGTEITGAIYNEITRAYNALGFTIVKDGAPQENKLVIEIDQLKYLAREKKILWEIEIIAAIKATAHAGTRDITLRLQEKRSKEYAKPPSEQQNEDLINEAFTKLLERLLEDNNVMELIKS